MLLIVVRAYSIKICNIQGPSAMSATATAIIFGIKVRDISWIWVITWKILTNKPTAKLNPKIGALIIKAVHNISFDNAKARSTDIQLHDPRYGTILRHSNNIILSSTIHLCFLYLVLKVKQI